MNWTNMQLFANKKITCHVLMVILIVFVVGFFVLGWYKCSTKVLILPKQNCEVSSVPSPTPMAEIEESLIDRCGDIPDSVMATNSDHWMKMTGPKWSPDCRYITWGIWLSGTSWPGGGDTSVAQIKMDPREGIYLYNDSTKRIIKIYKPRKVNETPEVVGWKNRWIILFSKENKLFIYDLTSKTIQPSESR